MSEQPKTLLDKIWESHVVATYRERDHLIYVDRCMVHEGSNHAFSAMKAHGRGIARPAQVIACTDHFVPTHDRAQGFVNADFEGMVRNLEANATEFGVVLVGMDDPRQGIMHVVGPEQGWTLPGMVITGADSHSSTHGAFGNWSFGIGASDAAHVLATQLIWQRRPKTLRVTVEGALGFGVSAKDVILALIAKIGIGGATGHVIEYAGSTISGLSMEQRMTICNMSIEAGGRAGLVAPDDTTFTYLHGRAFAPKDREWDAAVTAWRRLPSDAEARFDKEVHLDAAAIAPIVSWGTNPEHSLPITGAVPNPSDPAHAAKRGEYEEAIDYMGLEPGQRLDEIAVDRVFIGSCTNSRIEDMRAAAEVAKRGKASIPAWVVPGSKEVKRQAEAEGLDRIFLEAGFEWREPGCSLCTALNGDQLKPGERSASTSNRNFKGRQGPGGRTHIMSPAMAAAAALSGHLSDVRTVLQGGL